MQTFPLAGLVSFYQDLYATDIPFTLTLSSQGAAILVCPLSVKSRKKLAHDIIDTSATHANLVHDVHTMPKHKMAALRTVFS